MRTADRQRAALRRTRQLGETDEQFQERIRRDLEQTTGLTVKIALFAEMRSPGRHYELKGFTARGLALEEPLIRVVEQDLAAAAKSFKRLSNKWGGKR